MSEAKYYKQKLKDGTIQYFIAVDKTVVLVEGQGKLELITEEEFNKRTNNKK